MSLLRIFLDANSRLSARFDKRKDIALYVQYDQEVAAAIHDLPAGSIIVDLGSGRTCSFAPALNVAQDVRVVAVDISPEELAANVDVHETRVADVADELPFADNEVDLLVSRTLLEHVDGVQSAARNIARVLRPGGRTLHLLPCRYALFALVARLLPFALAKNVLHVLIPASRGVVEFDVVYDHTHPNALKRVFEAAGFREVEVECTWDQSAYFHALFPLFLVILLYQRVAEALGIKTLAAYAIVRAVR